MVTVFLLFWRPSPCLDQQEELKLRLKGFFPSQSWLELPPLLCPSPALPLWLSTAQLCVIKGMGQLLSLKKEKEASNRKTNRALLCFHYPAHCEATGVPALNRLRPDSGLTFFNLLGLFKAVFLVMLIVPPLL